MCARVLVTLLDTRTVPGELKWAASPSEGGVSGSSSSSSSSPFYWWQPVLPLEESFTHTHTHTLAHAHGLETAKESSHRFSNVLLFTEPKVLIWDRWRCVWHPRRHIPAWWWVSFLKGFLLACTCQDKSWKSLFYIISSLCFVLFVGTLMVPFFFFFFAQCLTPLRWFKSYWWTWLVFSTLSFSHMLLEWQGPGLHARSFWLQAPPNHHYLPLHAHVHTKRCTSLSDSCDSWQRLQWRWDEEASFAIGRDVFLVAPSSAYTHTKMWRNKDVTACSLPRSRSFVLSF